MARYEVPEPTYEPRSFPARANASGTDPNNWVGGRSIKAQPGKGFGVPDQEEINKWNTEIKVLDHRDVKYSRKVSSLKAFNDWVYQYRHRHGGQVPPTKIRVLEEKNANGENMVYAWVDANKDGVKQDTERVVAINGATFAPPRGEFRHDFADAWVAEDGALKKTDKKKAIRADKIKSGEVEQGLYEITLVNYTKPIYNQKYPKYSEDGRINEEMKAIRKKYSMMLAHRDVWKALQTEMLMSYREKFPDAGEDEKSIKKILKNKKFQENLFKLWHQTARTNPQKIANLMDESKIGIQGRAPDGKGRVIDSKEVWDSEWRPRPTGGASFPRPPPSSGTGGPLGSGFARPPPSATPSSPGDDDYGGV
jgi:hypothetical protein